MSSHVRSALRELARCWAYSRRAKSSQRSRVCRRDGKVSLARCAELLGGGQANLRPTLKDGEAARRNVGRGVVRDRLSGNCKMGFVREDPGSW